MTPNTQPRLSKESMEEAEKICESYVKQQGGSGFLRGKESGAEWSWKQHYNTWKPLLAAIALALDHAKVEGAKRARLALLHDFDHSMLPHYVPLNGNLIPSGYEATGNLIIIVRKEWERRLADRAARQSLQEVKGEGDEISLCGNGGGCFTMTKTIDGNCGKCGTTKLKPV